MKKVLLLCFWGFVTHARAAETGILKVDITGIKSAEGIVRIGLENSEDAFDKGELSKAQFRSLELAAKLGRLEGVFEALPSGTYAIKVFHDANSNGKLDSNFFGLPTEAYGFSNNVRGTLGPAKFKAAQFVFAPGMSPIQIELK